MGNVLTSHLPPNQALLCETLTQLFLAQRPVIPKGVLVTSPRCTVSHISQHAVVDKEQSSGRKHSLQRGVRGDRWNHWVQTSCNCPGQRLKEPNALDHSVHMQMLHSPLFWASLLTLWRRPLDTAVSLGLALSQPSSYL